MGIGPTHHFLASDTNLSCLLVFLSRKPSLDIFSVLTIGTLLGRHAMFFVAAGFAFSASLLLDAMDLWTWALGIYDIEDFFVSLFPALFVFSLLVKELEDVDKDYEV